MVESHAEREKCFSPFRGVQKDYGKDDSDYWRIEWLRPSHHRNPRKIRTPEANQLSLASQGWHGAPGLYTDAQISGWKKIVDTVHAKGCHIFAQLWHPGRFSHVSL